MPQNDCRIKNNPIEQLFAVYEDLGFVAIILNYFKTERIHRIFCLFAISTIFIATLFLMIHFQLFNYSLGLLYYPVFFFLFTYTLIRVFVTSLREFPETPKFRYSYIALPSEVYKVRYQLFGQRIAKLVNQKAISWETLKEYLNYSSGDEKRKWQTPYISYAFIGMIFLPIYNEAVKKLVGELSNGWVALGHALVFLMVAFIIWSMAENFAFTFRARERQIAEMISWLSMAQIEYGKRDNALSNNTEGAN